MKSRMAWTAAKLIAYRYNQYTW